MCRFDDQIWRKGIYIPNYGCNNGKIFIDIVYSHTINFAIFCKICFFSSPTKLRDLIKSSELMLLQNWEKAQKYESVVRNMLEKDLENYRNFLEHQFRKSPSLNLCISLKNFSSLDKKALYLYLATLAQPEQHVGVFLSICEHLGLSQEATMLKNKLQKQII